MSAPKSDLKTPSSLGDNQSKDVASALNNVLADTFALYLKTKNFHWHVSGPHFRDYHLLLDEQAGEIIASADDVAERVRKIGGTTLRSIGHVARLQSIEDNDADFVNPADMLAELRQDNLAYVDRLRTAKEAAEEAGDSGSSGMIDGWIDAAEKRVWFLFETGRNA